MEPNRKVRKQGLEHFIKFVRELPSPSPQLMFQALHELGYRGQESARRALCLMAYRHVKRIKRIYVDGVDRAELPRKSNFLFVHHVFRDRLRRPGSVDDPDPAASHRRREPDARVDRHRLPR
jgi:hypothetical protein